MDRVRDHGRANILHRILAWVTFAKWPLSVAELRHALAVIPGDREFDSKGCYDVVSIMQGAGGLLVESGDGGVQFIHFTAHGYFTAHYLEQFPEARLDIASTCLSYLSFDEFRWLFRPDETLHDILLLHPFLKYAAINWGHHVREHVSNLGQSDSIPQGSARSDSYNQTWSQMKAFLQLEERISDVFVRTAARRLEEWTRYSAMKGLAIESFTTEDLGKLEGPDIPDISSNQGSLAFILQRFSTFLRLLRSSYRMEKLIQISTEDATTVLSSWPQGSIESKLQVFSSQLTQMSMTLLTAGHLYTTS